MLTKKMLRYLLIPLFIINSTLLFTSCENQWTREILAPLFENFENESLQGTWRKNDGSANFTFNGGDFTIDTSSNTIVRGTFTTSNPYITLFFSEISYDGGLNWTSNLSDVSTGQYTLSGNTLTIFGIGIGPVYNGTWIKQ